jgi:hypothetical protein
VRSCPGDGIASVGPDLEVGGEGVVMGETLLTLAKIESATDTGQIGYELQGETFLVTSDPDRRDRLTM